MKELKDKKRAFAKCKIAIQLGFLLLIVSISLSFCACTNSSDKSLKTTSSTVSSLSATTTSISTTKLNDYTIPEEFMDYKKFIGEDISVLNPDMTNWKRGEDFTHDLWKSTFLGYPGMISIRVDWDYNTILGFFFQPEGEIPKENNEVVYAKVADAFGHTRSSFNSYQDFEGAGDYLIRLPGIINHESSIMIEWNHEKYEEYRATHPKITTTTTSTTLYRTTKERPLPRIGMTKSEVEQSSWGKPSEINRTTTQYGVREQWVYRGTSKTKYIYFEDGIVTAIQD